MQSEVDKVQRPCVASLGSLWGHISRLEKWTRNLKRLLFKKSFFFKPQEPIRKQ